jgi:hypothetical protein
LIDGIKQDQGIDERAEGGTLRLWNAVMKSTKPVLFEEAKNIGLKPPGGSKATKKIVLETLWDYTRRARVDE